MPARKGEEISPALVQLVENNLLLKQAIETLKEIKVDQESNHVEIVQLRDHRTIEKADKAWQTLGRGRWLLALLGALLATVATLLGALYAVHAIWRWP